MDNIDYDRLLGKNVNVVVDRKLGTRMTRYKNTTYTVNYGYIEDIFTSDNTLKGTYILGVGEDVEQFLGTIIALIIRKDQSDIKLVVAPKKQQFYEPQIRELVKFQERFFESDYVCLYEKTCGIVVYKIEEDELKFLIVKNKDSGHIGFPKGHIEYGETEEETAKREVYEETGLLVHIDNDFRSTYTKVDKNKTKKYNVYFMAEFKNQEIRVLNTEISKYWVANYNQAMKILNLPQDIIVLMEAKAYYEKKEIALKSIDVLKKMYPVAKCSLVYSKPYELLIATRLSAQCTDARVNIITKDLFKTYTSIQDFANADINVLENDIKSCGFYRTKAKSIIEMANTLIEKFNGEIPNNMADLTSLSGIGRKTANLIMGDIWGEPAIVTDTHCIRITGRLGLTENENPKKVEDDLRKILPPEESSDFCHRLVEFGREICKARNPKCTICKLNNICNFYKNIKK